MMNDFRSNKEMQYCAQLFCLPEHFFVHQPPIQIPQIYPVVAGVNYHEVQQNVQKRLQVSPPVPQVQSAQSAQSVASPSSSALPKISYPKIEAVDYYYQKFYGADPNDDWLTTSLHFNPWAAQSWNRPAAASRVEDVNHLYPEISMPPPTPVFSLSEFQKLRHHASVDSALNQLNELSICLNGANPESLPRSITRACFICANSYNNPEYKLGVGPVNDSVTVAANHKYMGYKVYYAHNPTSIQFLSYLKIFLMRTTEYLTIFYTGHGSNIENKDGTEESGFDQAMLFDDTYVKDDILAQHLLDYSTGSAKTLLLTDCCHSGTIWDIPKDPVKAMNFPANIVSISSSDDDNTAKQGTIDNNSQGLFTFFFWKTLKEHPEYTFTQIKPIVDKEIKKYNQECVLNATREKLLIDPFFPPH